MLLSVKHKSVLAYFVEDTVRMFVILSRKTVIARQVYKLPWYLLNAVSHMACITSHARIVSL